MSRNLHRHYGTGHLHFITSSCYKRLPLLNRARCDLFLRILEETRKRYQFVVVGYVLMPEHFHLLISQPKRGNPGVVMQGLKQRSAGRVLSEYRNSLSTAEPVKAARPDKDGDKLLERGHFLAEAVL
jgi:putative transposase